MKKDIWFKIIWNKEEIPIGWKMGIVYPIHIKRDQNKSDNYRGIMLSHCMYSNIKENK
jgi:2-keto-4-pentenoate hydratase